MNFDSISEEFQTDKTYLNNASVSVMPKTSIQAMNNFLISEADQSLASSFNYDMILLKNFDYN